VATDALDQLEIVKDIGENPELQDVEGIRSALGVAAKSIQALKDHPDLPQKEKLSSRAYLADEAIMTLIKKVGRDTPEAQTYILAVTETYLGKIDPPSDWMADIVETAQEPVTFAKLPALSYLDLTDASFQTMLETGVVEWAVNEQRVRDSYKDAKGALTGTAEQYAKSDIANLNRIAKELAIQVTSYVRVQGNIDWARSSTKKKPEYGVAIAQPLPGFPSINSLIGFEDLLGEEVE
jgi:hypothetical protein